MDWELLRFQTDTMDLSRLSEVRKANVMYNRILKRMQDKVRSRAYVMTYHARKEMNDDGLTLYDVERGILTGEILERQRDRIPGDHKYRIRGWTVAADGIEVVARLGPTGKLVIITVYAL